MRRLLTCGFVLSLSHSALSVAACNDEINNSRVVAQRIANEWPLIPAFDDKAQYVQSIADSLGQTIVPFMHTGYFEWPLGAWQISLVRDLSVNAYSIGNGRIYLTDGTFAFVNNEAELVAIIAHEMAHQLMGHFCQQDSHYSQYRIGSLVQVLDNNKEMEADALAIDILQQANFPANAMLEVVQRLPEARHRGSNYKRIRINALSQRLQGTKTTKFSSSPEFLDIKKKPMP